MLRNANKWGGLEGEPELVESIDCPKLLFGGVLQRETWLLQSLNGTDCRQGLHWNPEESVCLISIKTRIIKREKRLKEFWYFCFQLKRGNSEATKMKTGKTLMEILNLEKVWFVLKESLTWFTPPKLWFAGYFLWVTFHLYSTVTSCSKTWVPEFGSLAKASTFSAALKPNYPEQACAVTLQMALPQVSSSPWGGSRKVFYEEFPLSLA